jgi:hypothetical protein
MTEWILVAVLWSNGSIEEAEIENGVFQSPVACSRIANKLLVELPQPKEGVVFYKCRPRG